MDDQVLAPLNILEISLNALLSSLTTTNTFANAPAAARELLTADDALTSSLTVLKRHQENHNRILFLRAETERVQAQLKSIVRSCVDFRSEIGTIQPSILEDDEDEGEAKSQSKEVEYETLLAFAARIGKHNAAAAREAERDSDRRRIEAMKKKASEINGDTLNTTQTDMEVTTEESQAALASVNDVLAFQRASAGIAYPPPDRLRLGLLGQLQLLKEQQGEEAVDNEIERLVRQSEKVAESSITQEETKEHDTSEASRLEQRPAARPAQTGRSAPVPVKVKPVSLDFDDESDDD